MGIIRKGILGGFSGTVGTVVGSNWRGRDIIKSRPKVSQKAPTARQMEQRVKFSAAIAFLTPLKDLQSAYFGSISGSRSRVNLAVSYMMREALELVDSMPQIIYSKVQITKGDLTGFQNLAMAPGQGTGLEFTWSDNSQQAKASADDVFCTVCYCSSLQEFYISDGPETRSMMACLTALPEAFSGKSVQVYAFFHNAAGSTACNSVYLGTAELP